MTRPMLTVALHDGFYGCGSGAGHANRVFLDILIDLLPPEVKLVVLPVSLSVSSPEYDSAWHADTERLLARAHTEVVPVDNGTSGRTRFGGLPQFRRLVTDTADILQRLTPTGSRPSLVLAFDVPFVGLAALLPAEVVSTMVVVPRSTAAIHAPADRERRAWESYGLHATSTHGGRIAAISHYMRHHLTSHYWIPHDTLIDFPDGLGPRDWTLGSADDRLLPDAARGGFLLAMGRAHPYKGFDDLLDALAILRRTSTGIPHLVLAAVTDNPELNRYQRHLADRITTQSFDATLLTRFTPALRTLLTHPDLRGVIVPSRAEPFGRIPIEAYAAGAGPVIATTAGGLAEQVLNGHTGFTTPPRHPAALAETLTTALTLEPGARTEMLHRARQFARDRFDHRRAVRRLLTDQAPWLTPLADHSL
ncbi:glycosyltransferase family 4 protein [Nocardia blacklockiae]|uniref:glycosyltransferase family 4 protein n=1 Tax=Nocardia blacklockiae TaxID=480036 RepID=UPI00189550CC|nr:glycosyltransferase family 4 protein [Nocardia blacklockiae]MBF6175993.1 glycosyltransferase family 4 protein [Nocardia blacklockiae]